jgi:hypothetical protein
MEKIDTRKMKTPGGDDPKIAWGIIELFRDESPAPAQIISD